MSFEMPIVYEDRAKVRTSRWKLDGVKTFAAGNTASGWLWMKTATVGNALTLGLYKTSAMALGDRVAYNSAAADISGIESDPVKITLVQDNTSGMSGELYLEDWSEDVSGAPVLVTLCVDSDLAIEHRSLTALPNYDATYGMASFCAAATEKVLLMVSQMFADQVGGYGAPEHRNLPGAERWVPDYRRISEPKQLRAAAVHAALGLIFWACHEMADDTMYSTLGERHEKKYDEEVSRLNPAFNTDPDSDDDADGRDSASAVRIERV